jgi:hypothetical protein
MRNQFEANQSINLIAAVEYEENSGNLPSHYMVLQDLVERNLIPAFYLELLDTLETNDKTTLSKKLLRIYLYAASKIGGKKLYTWLQKGSLPQETTYGESMSALSNTAKKITTIDKSRNKTIDKITDNRKRLKVKSSKRASDAILKSTEKLQFLNNQYDDQKDLIEQMLTEIESSLASARKL